MQGRQHEGPGARSAPTGWLAMTATVLEGSEPALQSAWACTPSVTGPGRDQDVDNPVFTSLAQNPPGTMSGHAAEAWRPGRTSEAGSREGCSQSPGAMETGVGGAPSRAAHPALGAFLAWGREWGVCKSQCEQGVAPLSLLPERVREALYGTQTSTGREEWRLWGVSAGPASPATAEWLGGQTDEEPASSSGLTWRGHSCPLP